MNLEIWRPERLSNLWGELDWLRPFFGEENGLIGGEHLPLAYPAVEIKEDEENYYLEAEIPGLSEKEVEVYVENGVLTLKGEKKEESEKKEGRVHRTERYYGRFSRSFTIPENVAEDKIKARSENGMLKLTLPKGEETKPKRVEIKVH